MGLKILSPERNTAIAVDIVLIHGLTGDALDTWTSVGANPWCWPKDSLPSLFPSSRIMTFGYNSNVFRDGIKGRIGEYAENLLSELLAERYEDASRPIVFICHSMGGIVAKRALSVAMLRDAFRSVYDNTHSIIFMATPHRGSDKADYTSTAQKLIQMIPFVNAVPTQTIDELKAFSNVLSDINSDFVNICSKFKITCFYERKPMAALGMIVEDWSAVMQVPSETNRIAVASNHGDICKFSSFESDGFQTFFKQLRLLVYDAIRSRPLSNLHSQPPPYMDNEEKPSSDQRTKKRTHPGDLGDTERSEVGRIGDPATKRSQLYNLSGTKFAKTLKWRIPSFTSKLYHDRVDEFDKLCSCLIRSSERFFSIYGLGGVGKTQLALKYIDTHWDKYSHIFWAVADDELKLKTVFREIAVELGIVDQTISDLETCRQAVKSWLEGNTTWLLVLDNVESPSIHKDFVPAPTTGTIITTSRSSMLKRRQIAADSLQLVSLDHDQGSQLLLDRLMIEKSETNSKLAFEISSELGGHPLALITMAAYITDTECSLKDFLKYYRRNRSAIIASSEELEEVSGNYDLTLATCWSLSMEPLRGKPAGGLLGIISLLDPDNITEELLKDYAEDESSSQVRPLKDLAQYWLAFQSLGKHALIEMQAKDSQSSQRGRLVKIHRLVQEAWIRGIRGTGELSQAFDDTFLCLSRAYPHQVNGESMIEGFTSCRVLTPHIISLERHYIDLFTSSRSLADLKFPQQRDAFVSLLADAGWFLYETGQWVTAKKLFKSAEALCHQLFGDSPHQLTALIYNNIGVIHDSRNESEDALQYAMKSLKIREQTLDADDPEMGNSYSNYGHGLIDMGKYEEAQEYYQRAIEVHERCTTPSPDLLEGAYSCMGKSMLYLGRLEEAEHWIQKAIVWHEHFKSANFFVAETLFALGSLRMKQNRWSEAETLILKSLEIRKKVLGPKARLVGVCLHHLAFILAHEHNTQGAIEHLRRAVSIFTVPSETQPGLLQRSIMKLVTLLERVGDESSSKEALELTLDVEASCRKDPKTRDIDITSEKAWNDMVQVAYQCVE